MRLWSIHPSQLDAKGLVAVWREGLLALHVLRGQTKGYKNHPQLLRFKAHSQPVEAVTAYLHHIVDEAVTRGYSFDRTKLSPRVTTLEQLKVTTGQLRFETAHLKEKLKIRDVEKFNRVKDLIELTPHPLFKVLPGAVEIWEKISDISQDSHTE